MGCDWGRSVHLGLYPFYFSIRTYEFLGHITYMYMYVGMAAKISTYNWEYLTWISVSQQFVTLVAYNS